MILSWKKSCSYFFLGLKPQILFKKKNLFIQTKLFRAHFQALVVIKLYHQLKYQESVFTYTKTVCGNTQTNIYSFFDTKLAIEVTSTKAYISKQNTQSSFFDWVSCTTKTLLFTLFNRKWTWWRPWFLLR